MGVESPPAPETPVQPASARWVECFLLPALEKRFAGSLPRRLRCLQVEPVDEEEAIHLRRLGHECDIVVCGRERMGERAWQQAPVLGEPARMPIAGERFDFIWSGAFGRLNHTLESRSACARELHRICALQGGIMLTAGNRLSPLDLAAGSPRLHGPFRAGLVTLGEMRRTFVDNAGFAAMHLMSLERCFGWSQLPGALRLAAPWLEAYLSWSSNPGRARVYASALNPMFALWFERGLKAR